MNRGYTVAEYTEKIEMLRRAVPGVKITTDIICGFPGETERDFNETIKTVEKIKFNAAYIFPYSRRSGTAADKMEGQIPTKVKKQRATKLIEIMRNMNYNS
jgi:threonylcarbamoyladenosine tRNA methylthiotransferase MtaB